MASPPPRPDRAVIDAAGSFVRASSSPREAKRSGRREREGGLAVGG